MHGLNPPLTRSADVFSFGTVMWEVLMWQLPFEGVTNTWQVSKFMKSLGAAPAQPMHVGQRCMPHSLSLTGNYCFQWLKRASPLCLASQGPHCRVMCFCTQVQVAKRVMDGERLEIPADPSQLPGGTFGGMADYVALMRACWEQDPAARPSFGQVIAELR